MKRTFIILIFSCILYAASCVSNSRDDINNGQNITHEINETTHTPTPTPTPTADDILSAHVLKPTDDTVDSSAIKSVSIGNIEPIFYFNNYNNKYSIFGLTEEEKIYEKLRRTATNSFSCENEMKQFITYFMEMNGINKDQPDGIAYVDGKINTAYYIDSDSKMICFIVYDVLSDFIAEKNGNDSYESSYHVTCIIVSFDELEYTGYLAYENNDEQALTTEILYDTKGNRELGISYKYISGVPFPVITEYEIISSDYEYSYEDYIKRKHLNRSDRFRLYEDFISFDAEGRLSGYNWCLYEPYIFERDYTGDYNKKHKNNFIYDEDGKLSLITEVSIKEDLYGINDVIELYYRENGSPFIIKHGFPTYIQSEYAQQHVTNDNSGYALYDDKGRMVYRSHYVTSGGYSYAWFYEGDSRRPWACIEWGGMYAASIKDLDYYVHFSDVPDWTLESAAKGFFFSYGCNTTVRIFEEFYNRK